MRGRLLPDLANDALAAIGGVYIRKHGLDDLYAATGRKSRLSYSELAQDLVRKDLAGRISDGDNPVLIVGEERFESSGAVIRLRFPAWDIWNLALAAHEYGYLFSRGTGELLLKFREFCKEIRDQVDPSKHESPDKPPKAGNFIPEVRQLWNTYYGIPGEDERKQFIEKRQKQPEFLYLQDQQERLVRRLFADAFATLFGGPAYLYALLHLRFWPHEVVSPDMPRFADRFVFALEILRHMSAKPKLAEYRLLFAPEIHSLEKLWGVAREVVGGELSDEQLKQRDSKWVDRIYDCFEPPFTNSEIGKTYISWKESQDLEEVLRKGRECDAAHLPTSQPNVWTVIDAAWRVRPRCSAHELAVVVGNALSLLDTKDMSLIGSPQDVGGMGKRVRASSSPEQVPEKEPTQDDLALSASRDNDRIILALRDLLAPRKDSNALSAYK